VTANVDVGGADGVKTGYFEVELTQDRLMWLNIGMFRPGLDRDETYGPGDGWALIADTGGRFRYDGAGVDRQGRLKV
jgi:hypothetical protein